MVATTMTLNLRKRLLRLHTTRRRKRAVSLVREHVARFTKTDIEGVKLHKDLNEFLERNASGASFLWAKLKVSVEKSAGKVDVRLQTTKPEATAPAPKPEAKKEKTEEKDKQQKQA